MVLACLLLLGGCANELTGYNYSASDARSVQTVSYGTITDIQMVKIDGSKSGLGLLGGAATGGVAGSSIGKGRGSLLGAIGGAIIGGIAGEAVEGAATKKQGINMFIRLCSGKTISVVQELDKNNPIREGDPVAITQNRETVRVTYDPKAFCADHKNHSHKHKNKHKNKRNHRDYRT